MRKPRKLKMTSHQKLYRKRKADGICTICGVRSAVPGRVHCGVCTASMAARRLEKLAMKPKCPGCGAILKKGESLCQECAYIASVEEKIKAMREKKGTWTGEVFDHDTKVKIILSLLGL